MQRFEAKTLIKDIANIAFPILELSNFISAPSGRRNINREIAEHCATRVP
jgi:hypothetical protein